MRIVLGGMVIALGLAQFWVAAKGKIRLPFGLTEAILNRMPESAWRIAVCVVGVLVMAIGVAGIVSEL